jgi:hypothetical protein
MLTPDTEKAFYVSAKAMKTRMLRAEQVEKKSKEEMAFLLQEAGCK